MEQELHPLEIVIGLGANCGDRRKSVAEAIKWLKSMLRDAKASEIYETPAYGHAGSPYMNAVVIGTYPTSDSFGDSKCALGHSEYLRNQFENSLEYFEGECKRYEIEHGRDDLSRKLNHVPIDIDIVMAGEKVLRQADFSRSFFQIGYQQLRGALS